MTYLICAAVCAILMAVKGGWLGRIPGWNKLKESTKVSAWILDGTNLCAILFGIFTWLMGLHPLAAVLAGLLWWGGVMMSMGEEAGAVGGYKAGWGPYVEEARFGRSYGIKKALHRGIFLGAMLCLVMPDPWLIVAGAFFVPCYWLGISARQWRHFPQEWHWAYAEPLWGAAVGLAIGHYFSVV